MTFALLIPSQGLAVLVMPQRNYWVDTKRLHLLNVNPIAKRY